MNNEKNRDGIVGGVGGMSGNLNDNILSLLPEAQLDRNKKKKFSERVWAAKGAHEVDKRMIL